MAETVQDIGSVHGAPQTKARATLPRQPRFVTWLVWMILASALICAIFVRWRLREFPLERDEGEFAYAGQLLLQGVPPYQLAYNMKLPGTYLAYAALMAVFGQTTAGIHVGVLLVNLVTIVLLFFMVREMFDGFSAAAAAMAYSLLAASPTVLGMAGHATHFVALFGVAGTWLLWRTLQSGRLLPAFAAGALLGTAFLMKQQGVFLLCFGALMLLLSCLWLNRRSWSRSLLLCGLYAVGGVVPYAVICLWLWQAGVFDKFWFWTVTYARTYVEQIPLSLAWESFRFNGQGVIGPSWPLWMLAAVGLVATVILRKERPQRLWFVFTFLLFSSLCVCPGFYFRQHYFIVLLPAVALLCGAGAGGLPAVALLCWAGACAVIRVAWKWRVFLPAVSAQPPRSRQKRAKGKLPLRASSPRQPRSGKSISVAPPKGTVPFSSDENRDSPPVVSAPVSATPGWLLGAAALVLLCCAIYPIWQQREFCFFWTPQQACRRIYVWNPFVECPLIAEYLQKNTRPEQTIAVIGSEPELFFNARRRSATGYIYTYGLMEVHDYTRKMQEEMIAEIEAAKPEFVIFVNVNFSWVPRPGSETLLLEWALNRYLKNLYDRVGEFRDFSDGQRIYPYPPEQFQLLNVKGLPFLTIWKRKP